MQQPNIKKNMISIKLIGDPRQNVAQIMQNLQCNCGTIRNFQQILLLCFQKIEKLRVQRDETRKIRNEVAKRRKQIEQKHEDLQEKFLFIDNQRSEQFNLRIEEMKEQINNLQKDIQKLQVVHKEEIEKLKESKTDDIKKQIKGVIQGDSNYNIINEKDEKQKEITEQRSRKIPKKHEEQKYVKQNKENNSQTIKIGSQNQIKTQQSSALKTQCVIYMKQEKLIQQTLNKRQKEEKDKICETKMANMLLKYNISFEELGKLLQSYEQNQREVKQLFEDEQQRKLYKLGKKMEKNVWQKKVQRDIQKIAEQKLKSTPIRSKKGTPYSQKHLQAEICND